MSSAEWLDLLQSLQPFVYAGLVVAAVLQWRRRPGRASAWLAATFGVLGFVIVAGQLVPETSETPTAVWARKTELAILVLFPYCLYRFMTSFIRPIPWVKLAGSILTAGVALGAFALPDLPRAGEPRPAWFQIYLAAFLIQWVFLSGVVAVRFWRAGEGQPTVSRRRMRTMSLGAVGLATALVIAGESPSQSTVAAVITQLLALAAAPLMLIGFAPPLSLRMVWRRHEESDLKDARLSLMGATTSREITETLLPQARSLVGAHAALLEDADGQIAGIDGLEEQEARATIHALEADDNAADGERMGSLVKIPMSSGRLLTIIASPFTPFFGRDEIASLEGLAALADLALARTELLDTQRRLAGVVESSDDAIISKTLDGTITTWNPGAQRIYGYGPEEAIGQRASILLPSDIEDELPRILDRVRSGESIEHYETRRRTKDGTTIDVSLTVSPIKDADGDVVGASSIARDVTDRKKTELEREGAREEADRANRAKSEFLSRMSHELRTPLNSILGFAQLLEMDPLPPQQLESVEQVLKAGRHLLELIDEVLDIARIEEGKLSISVEPVRVRDAMNDAVDLVRPLAAQQRVSVDISDATTCDRHVLADRQRLKQVLLNLLANAIKYNREGGSVTVSCEAPDEHLRISISDTGFGISSSDMERLFVPFERLETDHADIEGTGIGLALSKRLVELMGGKIGAESERGKGSTFWVELALANHAIEDEPDAAVGDADEDASRERTILYVEDNLSNLKLVERIIARLPHVRLLEAMQGGLGVELARQHRPDMILLDVHLPDMRGEQVLDLLRTDPATADIPVVVISAEATKTKIERFLAAGARAYLTKPLDVARFLTVVDGLLGEGSERR